MDRPNWLWGFSTKNIISPGSIQSVHTSICPFSTWGEGKSGFCHQIPPILQAIEDSTKISMIKKEDGEKIEEVVIKALGRWRQPLFAKGRSLRSSWEVEMAVNFWIVQKEFPKHFLKIDSIFGRGVYIFYVFLGGWINAHVYQGERSVSRYTFIPGYD